MQSAGLGARRTMPDGPSAMQEPNHSDRTRLAVCRTGNYPNKTRLAVCITAELRATKHRQAAMDGRLSAGTMPGNGEGLAATRAAGMPGGWGMARDGLAL